MSLMLMAALRRIGPLEEGFVRNQELQWYQSQNAYVKDGCLVIDGCKERRRNPHYAAVSSDWRTNREFHYKYYLLLNRAISCNGSEPDNTKFPLRYYIDYVRVYQ